MRMLGCCGVVALVALLAACGGDDETTGTGGTTGTGASGGSGGSGGTGASGGSGGDGGSGGMGGMGGAGGMTASSLQIVVVGQTDSPNLPGALNSFHGGALDGLIARLDFPLDGSGATLAWSRYIGGNDLEQVRDVALDGAGQAYLTGRMASTNLATTPDAQQPNYGGGGMDAFVVRVAPDGAVDYASYFGGNNYDVGYGITVTNGSLVISGRTSSTDLPTSNGAAQASYAGGGNSPPYFGGDYFAFALDTDGTNIQWGTYAGGGADDMGRGRNAVAADGSVWVGGRTESNNFPVGGSIQGQSDGAVVKIAADGTAFTGGAILGGSAQFDAATGAMHALSDGTVLVCGYTSSGNFPASANAAQGTHGGGFDGMVAHLSADGSQVLAATYLGGNQYEECQGVDVLPNGDIVAVGITTSSNFPFTSGTAAGGDLWVARLSPGLDSLAWAIPVGGSGDEINDASRVWSTSDGRILIVGGTDSTDLPVTADASQSTYGGGVNDVFIALLAGDGSGPEFMTYLGGSGEDFPRAVAFREL